MIHDFVTAKKLEDNMHMEMLDHAAVWLSHWENKVTCWRRFFENVNRFSGSNTDGNCNGVLQSLKQKKENDSLQGMPAKAVLSDIS